MNSDVLRDYHAIVKGLGVLGERLRQARQIRERMRAHCAARYADDVELRAMFAELHTVLGDM